MAYRFSDSDTSDSESGIRFKTDSTRNKNGNPSDRDSKKIDRGHRTHHSTDHRRSGSSSHHKRTHSSPEYRKKYSGHSSKNKYDSMLIKRKTHEPSYQKSDYDDFSKRKKYQDDFPDHSDDSDKDRLYKKQSHRKKKSKKTKHKEKSQDEKEIKYSSSKNGRDEKSTFPKEVKTNVYNARIDTDNVIRDDISSSTSTNVESIESIIKGAVVDNEYGPALPPHLVRKTPQTVADMSTIPNETQLQSNISDISSDLSENIEKESNNSTETYGPSLPPTLKKSTESVSETSSEKNQKQKCRKKIIGPALPPHLLNTSSNVTNSDSSDEDEEIIGPLPVDVETKSRAQIELEERALEIKLNTLSSNETKAPIREEWMTELPDVQAVKLGLGPRQFRSREGPDLSDRSSWTETPEDKQKKALNLQSSSEEKVDLKREAELKLIEQKNLEQEEIINKLNADKKESLLEIHLKKMKEKKKAKSAPTERRPFDRDIDLKINRLDEAQKNAIFKKAQLLNDRFSQGKSKFL